MEMPSANLVRLARYRRGLSVAAGSENCALEQQCVGVRIQGSIIVTRESKQPYKMSFAVGGLNLSESIEVARIYLSSSNWDDTLVLAMTDGVTSLPKAASRRRTLREIVNRISMLSLDELTFLIKEADRTEQQALLWLASCRAYRFVREFAIEVLQDRFLAFQFDLPLESFDILYDAKAEWHEELERISRSTRQKLRQVLFRMMREAEIISKDNRIQHAYVSTRLKIMIEARDPDELSYFPGLSAGAVQ